MTEHRTLKELLYVFLDEYFDRCVNDNEKDEVVLSDFCSKNKILKQ